MRHVDKIHLVRFTILAGKNSGLSGYCKMSEFLSWAKFEVEQNKDGVWSKASEYT